MGKGKRLFWLALKREGGGTMRQIRSFAVGWLAGAASVVMTALISNTLQRIDVLFEEENGLIESVEMIRLEM